MILALVKSPLPTLIIILVTGTSLTLVHHIGEGLDNILHFQGFIFSENWTWLYVINLINEVKVMWGLGKKRTKLGKFLDKHNIEQEWLVRKSGLGRNTIGELANNFDRSPTQKTMQKILKTLREVDPRIKADDFWDMWFTNHFLNWYNLLNSKSLGAEHNVNEMRMGTFRCR